MDPNMLLLFGLYPMRLNAIQSGSDQYSKSQTATGGTFRSGNHVSVQVCVHEKNPLARSGVQLFFRGRKGGPVFAVTTTH